MAEQTLAHKAIKGVVWTFVDKFGSQAIQLVLGIIIARILSPEDYGIVGMIAIFMAVAQTLLDCGFGSALIQKKDRNDVDYSTCFWFNAIIGATLYIIFFFSAPIIADFYHTLLLVDVCRVVGLTFFINSLCISQTAKLTAELKFQPLSIISVASQLIMGGVGVVMAYCGYGVWALVVQMVGGSLLRLVFMEIYTRWLPLLVFSVESFNYLFSFGSKILCSGLINTIYSNIYTLVIGRVFTAAEVGLYNRANQFAALPSQTLLDTVMKVAYPTMAEVQDDNERLGRAYRKFLRLPLFVLYPILAGLVSLAHPFIELLLGTKWLPCVPYLQILAIGAMFTPLTHINLNILYVKGRTDLVLKLELIKKTIAFTILFSTLPLGILWLIVGKAFYELVAYAFNCYYTGKFINFGFWKQMFYNVPVILKSTTMGVACYLVANLFESPWLQLSAGIITGIIIYSALVLITKDESMIDIQNIIKSKSYKCN